VTDHEILAAASVVASVLAAGLVWVLPRRWVTALAVATGAVISGLAIGAAVVALADFRHPQIGNWFVLDAAGGLLLGVVGVVGLVGVLMSPAYLNWIGAVDTPVARRAHGRRTYFSVLFAFWGVLLAVPLAGNLGAAWVLIEATTAASALLVGFSGKPRALEAGWKYLVLTSLGLGIALLGIALIAAGVPGGGLSALSWRALAGYGAGSQSALVAYLLLMAGLAAKIGWAPVHNWLPDAHSEAPAPVSAMLSAALLPAVLLVAWRAQQGLAPAVGIRTTQAVFIAFGLVSVAFAIPFLARALAFKRLLAYSSLEHMGIIALGLGFASPLALAGVAIHVAGHAVAKALAFSATIPLLSHEPQAARCAVTGVGRTRPALGATMALGLGALSGLPPSPLFVSELLIIVGGFHAGHPVAAAAATALIALASVGLLRALIETTIGDVKTSEAQARRTERPIGLRATTALAVISAIVLCALVGTSAWLPTTDFVRVLMRGIQ
jgi:hydrogenase-4 component F